MVARKIKSVIIILSSLLSSHAWAGVIIYKECVDRGQTQDYVENLIIKSAQRYNIDPDLLWANAKVESGLNPCVRSSAGAIGVMQLIPSTALDLGVNDPYDAAQNIDGGAKYLSMLIQEFKVPQLYLAAYNAGPNAVRRKRYVPNYTETKKHIRLILGEYKKRLGINDDFEAIQRLSLHNVEEELQQIPSNQVKHQDIQDASLHKSKVKAIQAKFMEDTSYDNGDIGW